MDNYDIVNRLKLLLHKYSATCDNCKDFYLELESLVNKIENERERRYP